MTDPARLRAAALRYAGQGLWVFPCAPEIKLPYEKTTGCHSATANPLIIRALWGATDGLPNSNIGLAMGARFGYVAIDFDVRPATETAPAKDGPAWYASHRHLFPATWRVLTSGGGFHLIYALPAGLIIRNNASTRLAPGVDIRGEGGYILAPPSVHPNGHIYAWDGGPDDGPATLLPPALVALLCPPELPPLWSAPADTSLGGLRTWAGRGLSQGERDSGAHWLACSLARAAAPDSEAQAIMRAYCAACSPPFEVPLALAKWERARRRVAPEARRNTQRTPQAPADRVLAGELAALAQMGVAHE